MTALPALQPIPGMPAGWAYRGGIPWNLAPLPRRWHRCRPWHTGYLGQRIERCACGATRSDIANFWHGKNARRRAGER
jgi:hypothetical protein